jgi:phosphatidylserine/phosphatidylglycerophosphate/cardiolipin synthase-like enzyme
MIQNLNPSLFDLLPDLTGGIGNNSLRRDSARPEATRLRPVQASTGVRSTYVVPGDWPDKPDHWFADDAVTYPLRKQNNVEYLIDGEPTYEAMVEAIDTATGPDHFIILLGWTLHVNDKDFLLSKQGNRTASAKRLLIDILKERIDLGVTLRVLLYDNFAGDGQFPPPVVSSAQALHDLELPRPDPPATAKVLCILDVGHRGLDGCHHQKVLVVYGSEGLIGFFGGIDFHPDRVGPTPAGGPLHDVHARVTGDAAADLLVLAANRWNFSCPAPPPSVGLVPPPKTYPTGKSMFDMTALVERALARRRAPSGPHRAVKIGHTVGNPDLAKLQDNGVWPNVRKALREAKKFVYMEDQYLFSTDAMEELAAAARRISGHITIITPPDSGIGGITPARHAALKRLKELSVGVADKISIYVGRTLNHSYIHAKMFVVDDEVAIIGSANCNNRGYFYDSEDNGVIADLEWQAETSAWGGKWWQLDLAFAHKLRMALWSEHLNMPAEALIDGVAAEVHWRHASKRSGMMPYTINDQLWQHHEYDSFYIIDRLVDPRP